MDDALAHDGYVSIDKDNNVLILVVMDDALAPMDNSIFNTIVHNGLNPCCNG